MQKETIQRNDDIKTVTYSFMPGSWPSQFKAQKIIFFWTKAATVKLINSSFRFTVPVTNFYT